jgi:trans-aconitate methyltransferase
MMRQAEQRAYFSHLRHDLVEAVDPHVPRNVLDVGCGDGSIGALLKERYPQCIVTGVERSEAAAEQARSRLDRVFCGAIEKLEPEFDRGEFDLILLGDVLEHLVDPWSSLESMTRLLAPAGYVVSTVPNTRNWRIIRDLALRGRWEYADEGIMDRTHLRFFTESSTRHLFEGAGLTIELVMPIIPGRSRLANRLTLGLFAGVLAQKFLVRARQPVCSTFGETFVAPRQV